MDEFLISIIIPVFNVEDYILECLKSVTNQHSKLPIECILIDDCGTDESMNICEHFICRNQSNVKFKIVKHEINQGLSVARNSGINAASGQYILFVDSDDILTENSISDFHNTIVNYPEADLIISNHDKFMGGLRLECTRINPTKQYICSSELFDNPIYKSNYINPTAWNKLVRRQWLIDNRQFFEKDRVSEDLIWTYSIIVHKPNVAYNLTTTYLYRQRPNSILTSLDNDVLKQNRMIDSLVQNHNQMVSLYIQFSIRNSSILDYLFWSERNIINTCFHYGKTFHEVISVYERLCSISGLVNAPIKSVNKMRMLIGRSTMMKLIYFKILYILSNFNY